jgi:P4 family phage/plasmid primase-like protien
MNKNFFKQYMATQPASDEQKYIFMVDEQNLAFNIIAAGYQSVALLPDTDGYFSIDTLQEYMTDIAFQGKCRSDYCYIPACSTKKANDCLECYLKQEFLSFHSGWMLFKNKEYLQKLENQKELKAILSRFVARFTNNLAEQPDLNRFYKFNENGKRIGVLDMEIADYLIQTVPFFILGDTPYLYEQGVYSEDRNGLVLKSKIQELLYRDSIKSTLIQGIYNLLISQPAVQRKFSDLNNQPAHWVNFQNGYFDVQNWELISHDAKYLMINQIPFSFYPDKANNGMFTQKYLDISLPDKKEQQTFWQYVGYCMTTDTHFQKFLMIKGKGGTGKSVAISLIQYIVGIENCSSISLQDYNKRFYATGLFGKQLNACADIPCAAMQSVDIIKKAVGEDTLLYEKKGQDPTQFHSYAKLLFSANEMPLNLDDKTNAYYRRLLVLDMNQIIPEKDKDIQLKEKLKAESDYIISQAMVALKQLYNDNCFTESSHSHECIEELYRNADSIKAFLDEKTHFRDGSKIKRSDMYQYYTEYCNENDRQAHGKSIFFRIMKDKGYFVKRNSQGYYFDNISFKDEGFVEVTENDMKTVPFEQMQFMAK